jgi:cell division septum initiation protein DivIVA
MPSRHGRTGRPSQRATGRRVEAVTGPAAAVRDEFREQVEAKGHAVDNVRTAVAGLEQAIDRGDIRPTPEIQRMLEDLRVALEQDDDQKLGGKSAEAARFIARALMRELDQQVSDR